MPPQINKFYATDLSPGRSFAEYAVQQGIQTFCISWRNPTAAQRDWNMETYLSACKQAIAVACEITGADQRQHDGRVRRRLHAGNLARSPRGQG